jgi:hypothetical protein
LLLALSSSTRFDFLSDASSSSWCLDSSWRWLLELGIGELILHDLGLVNVVTFILRAVAGHGQQFRVNLIRRHGESLLTQTGDDDCDCSDTYISPQRSLSGGHARDGGVRHNSVEFLNSVSV